MLCKICKGEGNIVREVIFWLNGYPHLDKITERCLHCNGTGKEPELHK
jgi:hypothetical protein